MNFSFASNSILAKSRALYGSRLSPQNYEDLLSCKSISDVAAYLKNHKSYSDILRGSITASIHRGQLENLLSEQLFMKFASIYNFEVSIGRDFYKYFIIRNDITQLLSYIRLLNTGRPEEYLFTMPAFFDKHTQMDLFRLAGVRSFGELIGALDCCEYQKVLLPFKDSFNELSSKLSVEAALLRYEKRQLDALSRKNFKGKGFKEIQHFLKLFEDAYTISSIYRLKKLPGYEKSLAYELITPEFSLLSEKQLKELAGASGGNEFLKLLKNTEYKDIFLGNQSEFTEDAVHRYLYKRSLKALRFSTNPVVVMFSYMFLAENELRNITHIAEGIRYGLPTDEIRSMLCF